MHAARKSGRAAHYPALAMTAGACDPGCALARYRSRGARRGRDDHWPDLVPAALLPEGNGACPTLCIRQAAPGHFAREPGSPTRTDPAAGADAAAVPGPGAGLRRI